MPVEIFRKRDSMAKRGSMEIIRRGSMEVARRGSTGTGSARRPKGDRSSNRQSASSAYTSASGSASGYLAADKPQMSWKSMDSTRSREAPANTLVQAMNKRLAKNKAKDDWEEEWLAKVTTENRRMSGLLATAGGSVSPTHQPATLQAIQFRDLIRQVADEHERKLTELTTLRAEVEKLRLAAGMGAFSERSAKANLANSRQQSPSFVDDANNAELRAASAAILASEGFTEASGPLLPPPAEQVAMEKEPMEKEPSGLSANEELGVWKPRTQPWMSPSRTQQFHLQMHPPKVTPGLEESTGDEDAPEPDSPAKAASPPPSPPPVVPLSPEACDLRNTESDEVAAVDSAPDLIVRPPSEMKGVRGADSSKSVLIYDTVNPGELAEDKNRESETRESEFRESEMTAATIISIDQRKRRSWVSAVTSRAKSMARNVQSMMDSSGDIGKKRSRVTLHKASGLVESRLTVAVKSVYFEVFFAFIILANAGFIGAEIEIDSTDPEARNEKFFETAHWVFSVFFLVELSLRLYVMGIALFCDRDWAWYLLDVALLIHSIFEFFVGLSNGFTIQEEKNVRMLRVVRVVRNVRIVRVMRLVGELRTMLYAIFGCFRALMGLICLLVLILYFFAVFFTQGANEYRLNNKPGDIRMETHYGSLELSMFTLYKAMTAGVSWGDVLQPLMDRMHWFYVVLFLLFISFALFAVLNVVTGVFVESALARTQEEEETRLEEEARVRNNTVDKISTLFREIDADDSGTVSIEEFMEALNDEYVMGCFDLLDIETSEAEQLFHLLDPDSEGTVEIEEFVKGCLRLKGEAKSIDIAILMCENRRLMHKFQLFMGFVASHFDSIESYMRIPNGQVGQVRPTVASTASTAVQSQGLAMLQQESQRSKSWAYELKGLVDSTTVSQIKDTMKERTTAVQQVEMFTKAPMRSTGKASTAQTNI